MIEPSYDVTDLFFEPNLEVSAPISRHTLTCSSPLSIGTGGEAEGGVYFTDCEGEPLTAGDGAITELLERINTAGAYIEHIDFCPEVNWKTIFQNTKEESFPDSFPQFPEDIYDIVFQCSMWRHFGRWIYSDECGDAQGSEDYHCSQSVLPGQFQVRFKIRDLHIDLQIRDLLRQIAQEYVDYDLVWWKYAFYWLFRLGDIDVDHEQPPYDAGSTDAVVSFGFEYGTAEWTHVSYMIESWAQRRRAQQPPIEYTASPINDPMLDLSVTADLSSYLDAPRILVQPAGDLATYDGLKSYIVRPPDVEKAVVLLLTNGEARRFETLVSMGLPGAGRSGVVPPRRSWQDGPPGRWDSRPGGPDWEPPGHSAGRGSNAGRGEGAGRSASQKDRGGSVDPLWIEGDYDLIDDGGPGFFDNFFPPIVYVREWHVDFWKRRLADFDDPEEDRIVRGHGDHTTVEALDSGDWVVRMVLASPTESESAAFRFTKPGYLRFDGGSRVVSPEDENFTNSSVFGALDAQGEIIVPSISHHLDGDGVWRRVPHGSWLLRWPFNHLMGTLDLPVATLQYEVDGCLLDRPSGLMREIRAGEWRVDRDSGGAYATYERRGYPERLYSHRVGMDLDAGSLDFFSGVPFSYSVERSAPGSGCYPEEDRPIQVRFDAIEVGASEDLAAIDPPPRYRADAGEILLDYTRPGSVGIPYLTNDGALPEGQATAIGTVADVVERGAAVGD